VVHTWPNPAKRIFAKRKLTWNCIATSNLRKKDVPQGYCNWLTFSNFALTFDPLSETVEESDKVPLGAMPSDTWSVVALRYFLYCWQRIGNNQGELEPVAIDKVQRTLKILHSKM